MTSAPPVVGRSVEPEDRRLPPHHHRDLSGGWLRAAVFGAMDGLVSNLTLVSGVAGGGASDHIVVLTGLVGLVGGAFSMSAGEWTSVTSQNEATNKELDNERIELARSPVAEENELVDAWVARGLPERLAREVAQTVAQDPEQALRVHAQEELGVDPDKLPSPWQAATSSFLSFAVGAFVPLAPFLVGGAHALLVAFLLAGLALFGAGALVSRFTGRTVLFSGARQLLFGAATAAVTYGIGAGIGTGVAG
jgi:VIT1/CCC1 family predicted Fe2+/Mn2+ transporter